MQKTIIIGCAQKGSLQRGSKIEIVLFIARV